MSKKSKNQTPAVQNPNELVAPSFMSEDGKEGTEDTSRYRRQPIINIVQSQSRTEKKEKFGEGTVVIMPQGIVIAKLGDAFDIIPVLFFVTWDKRSDYRDNNSPMILEQTNDPNSVVARRARDRNLRTEPYPEAINKEWTYKYVENLNFIVQIDSGLAKGEPATLQLNVGDHYVGATMCEAIDRRNNPIYGNRFTLNTVLNKGITDWYGFTVNNAEEPFINDANEYNQLKAHHRDLKSWLGQGLIVVEDADSEENTPVTPAGEAPDVPF